MTPKELEFSMLYRQGLDQLTNNMDLLIEYARLMAKVRRQYYLACLEEGFTPTEALHMAAVFDWVKTPTSQQP